MKEELISLAKEKGFMAILLRPIPYKEGTRWYSLESIRYYVWMCELQKWLREKYNIDIIITSAILGYGYLIYNRYPPKNIANNKVFQFYEEALEEGLKEGLKLIE